MRLFTAVSLMAALAGSLVLNTAASADAVSRAPYGASDAALSNANSGSGVFVALAPDTGEYDAPRTLSETHVEHHTTAK